MGARKPVKQRKVPVQKRSQFTVDQILEAAAHIFARRGYAGSTTNHIADKAGVSIGSLYQYFPNKDAILVALLERHMEQVSGLLTGMIQSVVTEEVPPEQLLGRFVNLMLQIHAEEPDLLHIFLFEAPRTPDITKKIHRIEDVMSEAIENYLSRSPGISVRHARHTAYLIVHVVENLIHEFTVHPPKDMGRETFIQELVAMLCGYLYAPCSTPGDRSKGC